MRIWAPASALLLLLPGIVHPTTHRVMPDGSGDFTTIQAAITAAEEGDTIELADGTFTGAGNRDLDYLGKAIVVQSESGDPTSCYIDCGGSAREEHRAFHFTTDGDGQASISGIGIMNGYVVGGGGGIWIEGASPLVHNCAVVSCEAAGTGGRGGGLYVSDDGAPSVMEATLGVRVYSPDGMSSEEVVVAGTLDGREVRFDVSAHETSSSIQLYSMSFIDSCGAQVDVAFVANYDPAAADPVEPYCPLGG